MAKAIYSKIVFAAGGGAVDAGAEYNVFSEATGLAVDIYEDRDGVTVKTQPAFSDASGRVTFYVDAGLTFRVAVEGGSGTVTDRYQQGVLFGDQSGEVGRFSSELGTAAGEDSEAFVATVATIADLPTNAAYGQTVHVNEYSLGTGQGGGPTTFTQGVRHNGGTAFDPLRAAEIGTAAYYVDSGVDADCFLRNDSKVTIEKFGAVNVIDSPGFDAIDAIDAALKFSSKVFVELAKPYSISRKITYPRNAVEFIGAKSSAVASNTIIQPLDNTYSDDCLIDLNEDGSESGNIRGQFNRLESFLIRGGMADYKDASDPLVNLVGVKMKNTKDTAGLQDVTFRDCGVPFVGSGFVHWMKNIYVYQCHVGPDFTSTNSSCLDSFVIQTCAKNWGSLTNCSVHNATIQQGNEDQALDDEVGVTCNGLVTFTGYTYTEGGNAQINVAADATVVLNNWELGFAQLDAGGYGSHNAAVAAGSSLIVKGGKSSGVKSYLIGGLPDDAKNIHLDIEPYDSRIYNSGTTNELPDTPNLLINRTFAKLKRVNGFTEINYERYDIGVSTVTLFDQFDTSGAIPWGGKIDVQVGGSFSYDRYEVDFSDGSAVSAQVTINTIFRNTGGSGDNNIILSYVNPNLTAQGRKSDQKIYMKVSGYGNFYPVPIS
jgi:hypothetical protein